jgi:hypothetical protein
MHDLETEATRTSIGSQLRRVRLSRGRPRRRWRTRASRAPAAPQASPSRPPTVQRSRSYAPSIDTQSGYAPNPRNSTGQPQRRPPRIRSAAVVPRVRHTRAEVCPLLSHARPGRSRATFRRTATRRVASTRSSLLQEFPSRLVGVGTCVVTSRSREGMDLAGSPHCQQSVSTTSTCRVTRGHTSSHSGAAALAHRRARSPTRPSAVSGWFRICVQPCC